MGRVVDRSKLLKESILDVGAHARDHATIVSLDLVVDTASKIPSLDWCVPLSFALHNQSCLLHPLHGVQGLGKALDSGRVEANLILKWFISQRQSPHTRVRSGQWHRRTP